MTDDLDDSGGLEAGGRFGGPPSAKARLAAQRAVDALFEELAPERPAARTVAETGALERYHTPNGVVLQAPTAAVSVSWFPDTSSEVELGELQVILWRGVVWRRGAAPRKERAEVVRELHYRPVEEAPEQFVWRGAEGESFRGDKLAERCLTMLAEQAGASAPA